MGNAKKIVGILSVALMLVASTAMAGQKAKFEPVQVVSVYDGDTMTVRGKEGNKIKVRMYGIDAPESSRIGGGQPYWKESRESLKDFCKAAGNKVYLQRMDVDRYGRVVGLIWQKDGMKPDEDRSVNEMMVMFGMAEAYREYLSDPVLRERFVDAESQAKSVPVGIWNQRKYERPSAFRKRVKSK